MRQALQVPCQLFAHRRYRKGLTAQVDLHLQMAKSQLDAFSGGWRIYRRITLQVGGHLPEYPRVSETCAADHDRVAAGHLKHPACVFGGKDITVTDDRNGDGFL